VGSWHQSAAALALQPEPPSPSLMERRQSQLRWHVTHWSPNRLTASAPIYDLITSAKHTLEMTMYELSDATAETDLVRDAERGVKVEVVLDQNLAKSYNTARL
jgi:phosphatidylserine/phosphatidylglycerophosphate/cardiolipin synthase-like enzyme